MRARLMERERDGKEETLVYIAGTQLAIDQIQRKIPRLCHNYSYRILEHGGIDQQSDYIYLYAPCPMNDKILLKFLVELDIELDIDRSGISYGSRVWDLVDKHPEQNEDVAVLRQMMAAIQQKNDQNEDTLSQVRLEVVKIQSATHDIFSLLATSEKENEDD